MISSTPRQTGQRRSQSAPRLATVCVVDPQAKDFAPWESLALAIGLRLEIVASAEEALRMARTQTVDLWVINTNLPSLSGFELCQMLKARLSRTPVYLVADEYSVESEQAAWASRASLFGCKPQHATWLRDWFDTVSPSSNRTSDQPCQRGGDQ